MWEGCRDSTISVWASLLKVLYILSRITCKKSLQGNNTENNVNAVEVVCYVYQYGSVYHYSDIHNIFLRAYCVHYHMTDHLVEDVAAQNSIFFVSSEINDLIWRLLKSDLFLLITHSGEIRSKRKNGLLLFLSTSSCEFSSL